MTIEEALIKSEFGMTYTDEEHDQIIKWLEELRHYQLGDCMNDCEHYENCSNYIYSKGYNKAIDDFILKIQYNSSIADFMKDYLKEIAEQLQSYTKL